MKKLNVFYLGNELVEEDSLPFKIVNHIKEEFKDINFIELDPTEGLPDEENLIIIDSVINSNEVVVFNENEIDRLTKSPNYSVHDFDLAMSLKIANKLGKLKKIKIIGLPSGMDEKTAINKIREILRNIN